ncbi:MAG: BA14K family protein [Phyllobacteriaceae bacterium]|nr:BA14K family protein [Phyllobacteriaceae bacterium]
MRLSSRLTSLLCAAILAAVPAIASAQPILLPPGGGHVRHGPGPGGPGGPGPGFHPGPGGGPGPGQHRGGGIDRGAAAASGIIGLTAGAIAAGAASRASEEEAEAADDENIHVRRCLRAYRSYDPETDTFVDKYGRQRRCRL